MAVSAPGASGALQNDAHFDYVFSEAELEDVLRFMEREQDEKASTAADVLHGHPPPSSVSLQFQPHPTGGLLGNPYGSFGMDQGLNGAQPYLAQIGTDPFVSQSMGHPDDIPFDLSVQLEPQLNPGLHGSRTLGAQPGIGSEALAGLDSLGIRSPLEMSPGPSPKPAESLGQEDSCTLRSQQSAPGPQVKAEPLSTAFAKLGSGGLSTPSPRPRQYSNDLPPGAAAAFKKGVFAWFRAAF